MNGIERRIGTLESNTTRPGYCHLCKHWPLLVIRFDGKPAGAGWPEPANCPYCGRQPQIVRIGQRDDGPQ